MGGRSNINREIKISLVLPTYREKDSIRQFIIDSLQISEIKEIIVVDNNSEPGTVELISGLNIKIVTEKSQGYGYAIKAGIQNASQDYICVCEPDGTFLASDILKLKEYVTNNNFVVGTRTNSILIWGGANMGVFLKWGNWFVAKITEILFNTAYLSDVGCTYRLISKDVAQNLIKQSRTGGSMFGFEMMLNAIISKYNVIQIPVNYLPRIGMSSVTGKKSKAFILGMQMIGLLLKKRFLGIK